MKMRDTAFIVDAVDFCSCLMFESIYGDLTVTDHCKLFIPTFCSNSNKFEATCYPRYSLCHVRLHIHPENIKGLDSPFVCKRDIRCLLSLIITFCVASAIYRYEQQSNVKSKSCFGIVRGPNENSQLWYCWIPRKCGAASNFCFRQNGYPGNFFYQ